MVVDNVGVDKVVKNGVTGDVFGSLFVVDVVVVVLVVAIFVVVVVVVIRLDDINDELGSLDVDVTVDRVDVAGVVNGLILSVI